MPDIAAIIDPLIGMPYAQMNCWQLVRTLYRQGWGDDLDDHPAQAWRHVEELWWQEDPEDPLALIQPWDLLVLRGLGMASQHVGVAIDALTFIHTRQRVGVCLEPMRRWAPRLLQLARLRRLA